MQRTNHVLCISSFADCRVAKLLAKTNQSELPWLAVENSLPGQDTDIKAFLPFLNILLRGGCYLPVDLEVIIEPVTNYTNQLVPVFSEHLNVLDVG